MCKFMLVLPYYVLVVLVLPYQRVSYANTMPLNIYGLSFEILNTAIPCSCSQANQLLEGLCISNTVLRTRRIMNAI